MDRSNRILDRATGLGYVETAGFVLRDGAANTPPASASPDIPGSPETTATIDKGVENQVFSDFDRDGDSDWFAITLEAGEVIDVRFDGISEAELQLFDATGTIAMPKSSLDDTLGGDTLVRFTAAEAGVYYLSATALLFSSVIEGDAENYSLTVFTPPVDADGLPGNTTTPGLIGLDERVTGSLEVFGDMDWYRIDYAEFGEFTAFLEFAVPGTRLRIYDGDGNQVSDDGINLPDTITFEPIAGETYFLGVDGIGGAFGFNYTVVILPNEARGRDIPGDTTTTSVAIPDPFIPTVIAFMDADDDQDWFRIDLEAGEALKLEGFQDAFIPTQFRVQVRDATGEVLEVGQPGGLGGWVTRYTADEAGTFFISVEGLGEPGTQDTTISVQAIVSRDEFGDTPETAQAISLFNPFTVGGIQGALTDVDVFTFSAQAGQTLEFEVSNVDSLPIYLVATLSDETGTVLSEVAGLPNSVITLPFTFSVSGDYFVSVRAALNPDTGEASNFEYSVNLRELVDPIGATVETAAPINIGEPTSAMIEYDGDVDWFSVDVTAGEEVLFNVLADEFLFDTAITVRLRDANGQIIEEGVTGTDSVTQTEFSRLSFTPDADGTLIVDVQFGRFATGGYTLSVDSVNDPLPADPSTEATLILDSSDTAGAFEIDGDEDWYAVTVEAGDGVLFDVQADFIVEFALVDASGTPLPGASSAAGRDTFGRQEFAYQFETGGTYYLSVSPTDLSAFALPATFTVSAQVYQDDFSSNAQTEGVLPSDGTPVGGVTEVRGDTDWFEFTPEAGTAYLISLYDVDGSGTFASDDLKVFNAEGNEVTPVEAPIGGTATSGSWYFFDAGPYYVQASADVFNGARNYELDVRAFTDDHGDTAETATPIPLDSVTETFALLEAPGDQDWFSFSATAGTQLTFAGNHGPGAVYGIVNPSGEIVASTVFIEGFQGVVYDVVETGTHFLVVTAGALTDTSRSDVFNFPYPFIGGETDVDGQSTQFLQAFETGSVLRGSDDFLDLAIGRDGADQFFLGAGRDRAFGGGGNDLIAGGAGPDTLDGEAGDDRIFGEDGNDFIDGGDGNDYLVGNAGEDVIAGGAGDDDVQGREGNDRIYGGDGNDRLLGGDGGDYLVGNDGNDILDGGANNDELFGRGGNDTLNGDAGVDTLDGGAGDDILRGGDGIDVLRGGEGADFMRGGTGNDLLDGGAGNDSLRGDDGNDRLFGLDGDDYILGGEGDDYLVGNAGDDLLIGGNGNDNLQGREGNDRLYGEAGDDQFYGFAGEDELYGGDGNDFLAGYEGNDLIHGDAGNDLVYAMDDDDLVFGGAGDDFLIGNAGNDTVHGEDGNDNLRGRDGNDTLFGGAGNDFMLADGGNDTLDGGAGFDTMFGGAGSDTFVFSGNWRRDTVADWSDDFDVIDLTALGLKGAGETDADAFAKLMLVQDGTTAIISVTGDTRNDIRLSNTDISTLDAADFLFETPPAASAAQSDSFDFAGLAALRREVIITDNGLVDAAPVGSAPQLAPSGDLTDFAWAEPVDWQAFNLMPEEDWGSGLG